MVFLGFPEMARARTSCLSVETQSCATLNLIQNPLGGSTDWHHGSLVFSQSRLWRLPSPVWGISGAVMFLPPSPSPTAATQPRFFSALLNWHNPHRHWILLTCCAICAQLPARTCPAGKKEPLFFPNQQPINRGLVSQTWTLTSLQRLKSPQELVYDGGLGLILGQPWTAKCGTVATVSPSLSLTSHSSHQWCPLSFRSIAETRLLLSILSHCLGLEHHMSVSAVLGIQQVNLSRCCVLTGKQQGKMLLEWEQVTGIRFTELSGRTINHISPSGTCSIKCITFTLTFLLVFS